MQKKRNFKKNGKVAAFTVGAVFLVLVFPAKMTFGISRAENVGEVAHEIVLKTTQSDELYVMKFSSNQEMLKALEGFAKRDDVEVAEPNSRFAISAFPNDPLVGQQTYLDAIRVRDAWSQELVVRETRQVAREAVIAVLDTGVDINHPDLKSNIWVNIGEVPNDGIDNDGNGFVDDVSGWDFIGNISDPKPKLDILYSKNAVSHGTLVAGIAAGAGHNNEGISGISWKSKIMSLRVLDSTGNGNVLNVYKAMQYAIKNKANIINMSFVGEDDSELLSQAIKEAYEAGVIVVAAAGNSNSFETVVNFQENRRFPICSQIDNQHNYVVGVAAVDRNGRRSSFTNYGDNCVDISAPGEGIFGAQYYNPSSSEFNAYYQGPWSGTSLSAPMVTGALAILKTVRPDLSTDQLITAVVNGADPFSVSEGLGKGKLNVNASLQIALQYKAGEGIVVSGEEHFLVATLGFESFPQLKVVKSDGSIFKSFFPYSPTFKGPIHVATGNLDRDLPEEIVTGAGFGGGPHVRIFDVEGRLKGQFFAYDKNRRNGVMVAVGDIDGDGISEIVTGSGKGFKPEVKIFRKDGTVVSSFLAYNEKFLGGVNVASGDINGDGIDEIVTGPGLGGGPHIRIFDKDGKVIRQFFAFNAESRGGAQVAVGDTNNDIFEEIITAVEGGSGPVVRVYRTTDFQLIGEFLAFAPNSFSGLYLAVGDHDSDGANEIIVGSGIGGGAVVKSFTLKGELKKQHTVHIESYRGGVRVGIIRYRYL